ncbi:MAG: hypothetical protein NT067_00820 [Candidatus Diapherotrites archaeon]|nr:hypothetical protein [Candidatus Diapherotrites archaeon]
MDEKGRKIGRVEGLQCNGKDALEGKEGEELALSLDGGVVGRNIKEGDVLFTFIPENNFEKLGSLGLSAGESALLEEIRKMEEKEAEEVVE